MSDSFNDILEGGIVFKKGPSNSKGSDKVKTKAKKKIRGEYLNDDQDTSS